jgi:biotin operon repressor
VDYGIIEGVKRLTDSLEASRVASKGLSKSIENIQQDGVDVAKERAKNRQIAEREAEVLKEQYFKRAMIQWQKQEDIRLKEEQVKKDFVKHHGQKRWSEVETIKAKIEKQEKEIENEFRKDLAEVRRVMYMCYALAAVIAWYLTWGHKG